MGLCDHTQGTVRDGESTYEISGGRGKLKRVQGSGITSRGELLRWNTSLKTGENTNRQQEQALLPAVWGRMVANVLQYPIIPHVLAQGAGADSYM